MSSAQERRTAEVVSRRPIMPKFTEAEDLLGYCETCQVAYRIALLVFFKITKSIQAEEITKHNVDIKIRHRRWTGDRERDTLINYMPDKKVFEHSYELYSHQKDEYLVHCGVQTILPKGPHSGRCLYATMEIDLPIRKDAAIDIRSWTEKTLYDISTIAQSIYPNGISVIDQREAELAIETKIKTIIGRPMGDIPREPGWVRKETHYHGELPRRSLFRQQGPDIERSVDHPRSEIDRENLETEAMEIDFREATVPQEASNLGTITTEATEAVQIIRDSGTAESTPVLQHPRPYHPTRRATIPLDTYYSSPRQPSTDQILLQRQPRQYKQPEQQMKEGESSRQPLKTQASRVRYRAQQEAKKLYE